ncbi:hypothetical protein [Tropicibacter sp. S64]|uniref:hypothetical protein n=1 Tax=Tropicibacter sp. S64 TaxID=3415122 RepID=UPI003C7E1021
MTTHKDKDTDGGLWTGAAGLGDFFEAARTDAPRPTADFMARLEAQALAALPRPAPSPGLLRQLLQVLGGWPGAAGLATACAVGLWMGINPPAGLTDYIGTDAAGLDSYGVDPLSGFDLAMMEG